MEERDCRLSFFSPFVSCRVDQPDGSQDDDEGIQRDVCLGLWSGPTCTCTPLPLPPPLVAVVNCAACKTQSSESGPAAAAAGHAQDENPKFSAGYPSTKPTGRGIADACWCSRMRNMALTAMFPPLLTCR